MALFLKVFISLLTFFPGLVFAQGEGGLSISAVKGLKVEAVRNVPVAGEKPLFSFEINDTLFSSLNAEAGKIDSGYSYSFDKVKGIVVKEKDFLKILFENSSADTINISNVVPFGALPGNVYITASGPWSLTRTKIFRPGLGHIGVILPDNAWEMGYGSFNVNDHLSVCAIARRQETVNAVKRRYSTIIPPGGSVTYHLYYDTCSGEWQNGLKIMFREKYLYDLEKFDNTLFEREDLGWIRNSYIITLQFAWDHNFYDRFEKKFTIMDYLNKGKKYFGYYDVYGIWPTWPALGIDQRNQWELYEDLPGGLNNLQSLAEKMREDGTHFFIAYNPWDQSTRKQNPYEGMGKLIKNTDADGVVLDTQGSSSDTLQMTADNIKPGVIMYSEGMAVPRDMPGIVSGRVHDAIFLPPTLNLNKYMKPDFAIFRVIQLREGRIHREIALSFFNGYGVEINTFGPGRPDWMEEEYLYLGRTTKILRDNSGAFNSLNWRPAIPTISDSIWVNEWPAENKTVYTIFSLKPEGYTGGLFESQLTNDFHFVSVWHHEELKADTIQNGIYIPVSVSAFNKEWLGTRLEGNVDCVIRFPKLLDVKIKGDSLFVSADKGDRILVWAGSPSYQNSPEIFSRNELKIKLLELFEGYEGKYVIQLFEGKELIDERIVVIEPGTPRLYSGKQGNVSKQGVKKEKQFEGMVKIPAGDFTFKVDDEDAFIPYPAVTDSLVYMNEFYIDKYPVTNEQFKEFIKQTGYRPEDTVNYLSHWKDGAFPVNEGNHPVVFVSLDDARAYAEWAGKRLPSEIEWQYAGQGNDTVSWPWGSFFDSTKCNNSSGYTTPVDRYPRGAGKFGVMDMTGNVWQMTNDIYNNGSYYFNIMKGGSYYNPTSSWWYVKGGPRKLNQRQMLLLVSPGFERNATVGFRCVKDIK
jgi:formylglycine-generating enzyme required for sulfatase activity